MTNTEQTINAEEALAGAIILLEGCIDAVPNWLSDRDFASDTCRTVYQAARDLQAKGRAVDPVTVLNWSERTANPLSKESLIELMRLTPDMTYVADYSRIIHENGCRRLLQREALRIAQDEKSTIQELGEKCKQLPQKLEFTDENLLGQLCEVTFEQPRWLIEPYFPRGKGTLVQAEPGTGKTALMCAIAAAVTSAKPILGMRVQTPGDVLMISTEDDLSTLRGRVEANGGDVSRVHFLRKTHGLTLDSPVLEQAIRQSHARLVILDPFQAFLGPKVDMHRANETRPILAKLFDMCSELDCACVIVAHLGKSTLGKSPVTQSLGSVDIPAAMRSILHIVRNPQCDGELLAYHVKSSNAPLGKTIAYTIVDRGGVAFTGYSDLKLKDLEKQEEGKPYDDYAHEPLVEVFHRMLTDYPQGGFWSYDQVRDAYTHFIGSCPYNSGRDLRTRLSQSNFAEQLLERDKIRLTVGVRYNKLKGIRLENYTVPTSYQASLPAV